jgi:uncharacterized membrane protein SpoIIM required for sporulation
MIERFVAARRARWERLNTLIGRAASPRSGLSVAELEELTSLYRRATSDLATARRDFPDDRSTAFVNQLVARGHSVIYREPATPLSGLRRFAIRTLPAEFRSAWPFLVAAAALFVGPLIAALIAVSVAPEAATLMLPAAVISEVQSGGGWFDIELPKRPLAASLIMTNNLQVAFFALGGGMLAGLGTVYVLFMNGLSIGALMGAFVAYGLTTRLLWFVSPHGFMELSVIVIAGACGLMLARAIVWPGLRPRGQALTEAGSRSVRLLLGVLPFLVVAGVLEGFVSPADFAWYFKLAIGLFTAVVMYGYLLLVGRPHPPRGGGLGRGGDHNSARSFSSR